MQVSNKNSSMDTISVIERNKELMKMYSHS